MDVEEVFESADWIRPGTSNVKLLTSREFEVARKTLLEQFSILHLMEKKSRSVESLGGGEWTHKCVCPNIMHKQGNERTPSCCFSEQTKKFHCFGCNWSGDVLTLMARFSGQPIDDLIEDLASGLELGDAIGVEKTPRPDLIRINLKLSVLLRDYLKGFRGTECYKAEIEWVDHQFKLIDERLERMNRDDNAGAKRMYEQVIMDLERRKMMRSVECGGEE